MQNPGITEFSYISGQGIFLYISKNIREHPWYQEKYIQTPGITELSYISRNGAF